MLGNRIVKFVTKRAILLVAVLSVVILLFIRDKWFVLTGLVAGSIFGVVRLGTMADVLVKTLNQTGGKSVAVKNVSSYIINQIVVFVLLAVSFIVNKWIAAGMITGIFIVPFLIFINSLTEGLGITHNNFE